MRKLFLLALLACFLTGGGVEVILAQDARVPAREAEWQSYSLPKTNFTRQTGGDSQFLFRVPEDWNQEGTKLLFRGPHSAKLEVFVEKIADGMALSSYVAAIIRNFRNMPGATDSTILRRASIQDLDAREIVLEFPNPEGEMVRSILWVTVHGPLAVSFSFIAPSAHAAELEPYFKAVMQSVMFVAEFNYPVFEKLRTEVIKTESPVSIGEVQELVTTLDGPGAARESTITKLTSILSSTPDAVIDLVIDRRPFVRAAAVEALVASRNSAFEQLWWKALDDREPLVAEPAARMLATVPNAVAKISKHSLQGYKVEPIARIWPYLAKEQRLQILERIFSQTAPKASAPPVIPDVTKTEIIVSASKLKPVVTAKPPSSSSEPLEIWFESGKHAQLSALTLLRDMPVNDFKLPLARIMSADDDVLTAVALHAAMERGEPLSVELLQKLVSSGTQKIAMKAAESLGWSAGVADIPAIEKSIASFEAPVADTAKADKSKVELAKRLKLSIKEIQFRDRLARASTSASTRTIVKEALANSEIAEFVWRFVCVQAPETCGLGAIPSNSNSAIPAKPNSTVVATPENIFPQEVQHFAMVPNPGQAIQNLYESLQGIQMDSARGQSNLVLIMSNLRKALGEELAAPPEGNLIDYTGIRPDAPIFLASWMAGGADQIGSARRQAVVLRVKDRGRFERFVEVYQRDLGSLGQLPDRLAIITRLAAALPAVLPLSAKIASSSFSFKRETKPLLRYSFAWGTEWNGFPIRVIEHRQVQSPGEVTNFGTYLIYVNDTVMLCPDPSTLHDLMGRLGVEGRATLASNTEFQRVSASDSDIVYFADLDSLLATFGESGATPQFRSRESGELSISKSSWENVHRLTVKDGEWVKSLIPFQPSELLAPRDLLPSSTIAYYFMKLDLNAAGGKWSKLILDQKDLESVSKAITMDFESELLPELGPECGVALLDLPELSSAGPDPEWAATPEWLAFCRIKGEKLQSAYAAGKLFREKGKGPFEFKNPEGSTFVDLRNGFFVLSNRAEAFERLNDKDKLVKVRDYSRAAAKVPNGVIAFGGYNTEAALAAVSSSTRDGLASQIGDVLASITRAFHSQYFYATSSADTVEGRSSVAMDREGRYAISDLSSHFSDSKITYASVEAHGLPIVDQKRLSSLTLRIRSKSASAIERILEDTKTPHQTIEQRSANELSIKVEPRRWEPVEKVVLPINSPDLVSFLKATGEIRSDAEQVIQQAREIAGDDRDAWSVARKLADWTYNNLEWKFVARADASQTLATREADCSEFSQLYVAMARSLGLPARIVSGLAYSGSSFGGHAWVEVWIGKWIELDPTWGTHFVDATHIRNDSGALTTYVALNQVELEVTDAPRTVADFQTTATALAEKLTQTLPAGDNSALYTSIDIAITTDALMGQGAWAKMTEAERDQMSTAYRRAISEILTGYGKQDDDDRAIRVLKVDQREEHAEVTALMSPDDLLLKFQLYRQDEAWHLIDILQADSDLRIVSETLRPFIKAIEDRRAGRKPSTAMTTDFVRILLLFQTNAPKAIEVAENALKGDPSNRSLRYLKALGLLSAEKGDEGLKLLTELSNEQPPFAPALYQLADLYDSSEDEAEKKQAAGLYQRYLALEPYDSRAHTKLAVIFYNEDKAEEAEASYRKAIEVDPTHTSHHINLVEFLVHQNRLDEATTVLNEGEKHKSKDEDLFGQVIRDFYYSDDYECAKNFAVYHADRMKTSRIANYNLALLHFDNGRYQQALRLLKLTARLDPESSGPLTSMSEIYLKLGRLPAALAAADRAIALNPEDADAHYQRACALARLRRTSAAMSALNRSIELEPQRASWISEDPDLRRLRSLPDFKKHVAEAEKAHQND